MTGTFWVFHHGKVIQAHIAGGGFIERGHDAHGGGFACAVGADKAKDLAALKLKGYIIDRYGLAELATEVFHDDFHGVISSGGSTPITWLKVVSFVFRSARGFSRNGEPRSMTAQ